MTHRLLHSSHRWQRLVIFLARKVLCLESRQISIWDLIDMKWSHFHNVLLSLGGT